MIKILPNLKSLSDNTKTADKEIQTATSFRKSFFEIMARREKININALRTKAFGNPQDIVACKQIINGIAAYKQIENFYCGLTQTHTWILIQKNSWLANLSHLTVEMLSFKKDVFSIFPAEIWNWRRYPLNFLEEYKTYLKYPIEFKNLHIKLRFVPDDDNDQKILGTYTIETIGSG